MWRSDRFKGQSSFLLQVRYNMETVLIVLVVLFCSVAGLGILSLARLARTQDERVAMPLDPKIQLCDISRTRMAII